MIVYGLDLSLANTGVSIYDTDKQEVLYIGSINTDKIKKKKELYHNALKLKYIFEEMHRLKTKYPPQVIAIERGFSRYNTSTQVIYRVHGIINLLFYNIKQIYYPPKKVKEVIVRGDATKKDIYNAIKAKYNDITFANEDESDSFAVLLTYLIENDIVKWEKPNGQSKIKKIRKPK